MINLNEVVFDKKKVILIFIVFATVVYADIAFLMRWQFNSIKNSGPEVNQLKQNIDTLNSDIARMEDEKKRQDMERKMFKERPRKIPSNEMLPQVLSRISDLANKNGVKIMQIDANRSKGKPAQPAAGEPYPWVPVTADLICEYHQFGAFLNDIEEMDEVVAVMDFRMIPDPEKANKQNINITFKAYVDK